MAIYKLGDIADIKRGSSPRPIHEWLRPQGLPWAKISDLNGNLIAQTKEFVDSAWERKGLIGNRGDLFITNSASPGIPFMQEADTAIAYHDGFLFINPKKEIILKKFLLYKLIIDRPKLVKMGNGAVFINLSSEILKNWIVDIPTLEEQQAIIDIIEQNEKLFLAYSNCVRIDSVDNVQSDMKKLIDIIEPIENQIQLLNKYLLKVEVSGKLLSRECSKVEKMIENCVFEKGKNHDGSTGKVPFLNVSAANGKINNYCDSVPNIQIGDVMLSLDGNTGLVNNFLDGFNGYLYKVWSQKFKNFEIYYSLKSEENQSIIKLNETGTTIKHSPNSKKELKFFSFINRDALEQLFNFEILLKKQIVSFEKCKAQLIHLLIK